MLKKITQDSDFNEMMKFIKEEVISLMTAQQILKEEQEEILPIMKENYDGYIFNRRKTKGKLHSTRRKYR